MNPTTVERRSADDRFALTLSVERIEKLAGKYNYAAKVVRVWDDRAARDVTGSLRGQLSEHWGVDQSEAMEKALIAFEAAVGIESPETPQP
jgi:hypothetical protein